MSIEYILISINGKPSYIRVNDNASSKSRVPFLSKYKEEFCESTGLDSHNVEVVKLPLISWEKDLLIRETIAADHLGSQEVNQAARNYLKEGESVEDATNRVVKSQYGNWEICRGLGKNHTSEIDYSLKFYCARSFTKDGVAGWEYLRGDGTVGEDCVNGWFDSEAEAEAALNKCLDKEQDGWKIKALWRNKDSGWGYYCSKETKLSDSYLNTHGNACYSCVNGWHNTREEAKATLEKHLRSIR